MNYDDAIKSALEHARADYPRESCGLVYIRRGRAFYRACQNIATDPEVEFMIGADEYAEVDDLGDVVMVVHSHPNTTPAPSQSDDAAHSVSGLAWLIIAIQSPTGEPAMSLIPPVRPLPLLGRTFSHGIVDCYTLVRDYYKQVREITLLDFVRDDDWWSKGDDLYSNNYEAAGFLARPDGEPPQIGDVLLMNIASGVLNHAAVFYADNVIIHHLHGRLSCTETYSSFYRDRTQRILYYAKD
jgi:proteasome lid subunit RPN8/RPN11